jgi:O-antigen ligase
VTLGAARLGLPFLLVATGVALVALPETSLVGVLVGTAVVLAWLALDRLDALPRRPGEIIAGGIILLLPLAPFLNTFSVAGTLLRLSLAAAFVFLLATGAIERNHALPGWMRAAVFLFVGVQLLALVGSPSLEYGLLRALNWLMFIPLAFASWDSRARRVLLAFALLSGLLLVGGFVLQVLGIMGGVWGGYQIGEGRYERRYTSFLLNPNDFGLAMLITATAAFVTALFVRGWLRAFLIGIGSLFALAMLLTVSRGALIAAAAVLLVLMILGGVRRAALLAVVVAAAASAVIAVAGGSLSEPVGRTLDSIAAAAEGRDASLNQRQSRWVAVVGDDALPLIGGGYGGYQSDRGASFELANRHETYVALTVDSGWLKLWTESGVMGLLLLAAVFVAALARSWRLRRWSTPEALIGGSVLVALAVRATTADVFDINPWNAVLWLAVGVVLSPAPLPGIAERDRER